MSNVHRFHVIKEAGILKINGLISEEVNFDKISEHLRADEATNLDLAGVSSCSWNGLLAFDRYLSTSCPDLINLHHVPYGIFEYMKMLPNFKEKYSIESLEMKLVKGNESRLQTFSKKELLQIYQDSSHQFVEVGGWFIRGE